MQPFDLKTKHYSKKGALLREEPYIMYVEDGKTIFERPPHSGEFYYIDGSSVDEADEPKNTYTNQVEKKEAARMAKPSPETLRKVNKKLKAHSKQLDTQEGGLMDPADLDSDEQAALDALVGEEEQISATQPKEKTNAEAQKKA